LRIINFIASHISRVAR